MCDWHRRHRPARGCGAPPQEVAATPRRSESEHRGGVPRPRPGDGGVAATFARARLNQVNCSLVVGASGSQPRVGVLVTDETSLMEICRPRVFGLFTSTSDGVQVCWLIF